MAEPMNPIDHLGPIESCPGCGEQDFLVVELEDAVAFRCLGCDSLWRYELGYVWAVKSSLEMASRNGLENA